MMSSGKIEIEKLNGQSFDLWKLKMEDLLVDWLEGLVGSCSLTHLILIWFIRLGVIGVTACRPN